MVCIKIAVTAVNTVGDYDIAEVLEHLMHTIHLYGVPSAVTGSQDALQWIRIQELASKPTYYAMKEAVDNGIFSLRDYMDGNIDSPETGSSARSISITQNFGMWSMVRNSGKMALLHLRME